LRRKKRPGPTVEKRGEEIGEGHVNRLETGRLRVPE
jgi:hypothetical protein